MRKLYETPKWKEVNDKPLNVPDEVKKAIKDFVDSGCRGAVCFFFNNCDHKHCKMK